MAGHYIDTKSGFCNGAGAFQLNPQATFDVRPSYIDPCVISTDNRVRHNAVVPICETYISRSCEPRCEKQCDQQDCNCCQCCCNCSQCCYLQKARPSNILVCCGCCGCCAPCCGNSCDNQCGHNHNGCN